MQHYCCLLQVPAAPMSCARWIWPCTARIQACIYWAAHCVQAFKLLYIYVYGPYMPNPSLDTNIYGFHIYVCSLHLAIFHTLCIMHISFWHVSKMLSYITTPPNEESHTRLYAEKKV